jgi:UDPglucose 6-dehydrogenase
MRLAVVGLGKLGSPMAALLASVGHEVVGADLNARTVAAVNSGEAPVVETGLEELMVTAAPHLRATTSVEDAVEDAEVVFCIVPTPSLPDSSFDTRFAEAAFEAIGRGFARKNIGKRVAVLTSTVLPGATETRIQPALQRGTGEEIGERLGLCYSPEFIALGSVIANMRRPDMLLMGASDTWAGNEAIAAIKSVVECEVPVALMSIINAEMTKIAVNTFITTKISYANMIAEMCERLPGADASVVTAAIGLDSRIGWKYLQPAAPYGGPCFPRDNAAFAGLARSLGVKADIAVATDDVNRRQVDALVEKVVAAVEPGGKVAVLGLSYKPSTPVSEEAFGVFVATELVSRGFVVSAYDPQAAVVLPGVDNAAQLSEAIAGATAVIVTTPWSEFGTIESLDSAVLFDYWRIVPLSALSPGTQVLYPGVGPRPRGSLVVG